ncbi:MAG TPA: MBL fold metallo-hydrolase [Candidatus Acidoferrales bacterium]|nr:MBL fold metallo-hydrolase [Candidatus Acidoferrales bacterium]
MKRYRYAPARATANCAILALAVLLTALGHVSAQQDQNGDKSDVHLLHVQGRVYMLVGAGANITVQVGDEAIVLVDSGVSKMSGQVLSAIRTLSPKPIEFILNTSVDDDHTGGNQALAQAGHYNTGLAGEQPGASIVAHLRVLDRMTTPVGKGTAVPEVLWPTDTYDNDRWDLFNDEPVIIEHPHAAHTDGDSIAFFRRSDVVSVGDIFAPEHYPVIDTQRGGSISGEIDALNRVIELLVPRASEEGGTYVVPGHGRLCDRAVISDYRDMVTIIRDRVEDLVKKGKTLEQVKATKPTLDYDGIYGADTGPWTTEMFVEAVYRDLSKAKNQQGQKAAGSGEGR